MITTTASPAPHPAPPQAPTNLKRVVDVNAVHLNETSTTI